MALSASALTTVAALRAELDLDVDPAKTALLERYIEAASAMVVRFCGRELAQATRVEKHRGMGTVRLFLNAPPIVSITSIVIDDDALDAADFEIEDAGAGIVYCADGFAWSAQEQAGPSYHLAPGTEAPSIVVTYVGGWITPSSASRDLPFDIEQAVIELAVSMWKRRGRDVALTGESFETSSYSYVDGLPGSVAAKLMSYRFVASA